MAIVIKGGEVGQDVYYAGSLNGRPVWSMYQSAAVRFDTWEAARGELSPNWENGVPQSTVRPVRLVGTRKIRTRTS